MAIIQDNLQPAAPPVNYYTTTTSV